MRNRVRETLGARERGRHSPKRYLLSSQIQGARAERVLSPDPATSELKGKIGP